MFFIKLSPINYWRLALKFFVPTFQYFSPLIEGVQFPAFDLLHRNKNGIAKTLFFFSFKTDYTKKLLWAPCISDLCHQRWRR